MNSVELVVARYNEDMSWIYEAKDQNPDLIVTVYNKGGVILPTNTFNVIPVPNVGNEAETYLRHMITGHALQSLARLTLFVQGRPYDHVHQHHLYQLIRTPEAVRDFEWLAFHHLDCKLENQCHHGGLPIAPFYMDLMGIDLRTNFHFGVGGMFAVSDHIIYKLELSHLIQARNLVLDKYKNNEPWCILERIWDQVLLVPGAGRYNT